MELIKENSRWLEAMKAVGTTYTVIERCGRKGIEIADPCSAAQSFFYAPVEGRPFVLCNRSRTSCVIADTRRVAGSRTLEKHVIVTCNDGGAFLRCYSTLPLRLSIAAERQ